jgi:hypothetical protein
MGVSSAALAQADPKTPVTLLYYTASNGTELKSVSVSRKVPELPTQAAYMFKIENKATTDLGRVRFTATLTTTGGATGDNGKWSTFYIFSKSAGVSGSFNDCTSFGSAYLHCESDVFLPRSTTDSSGNPVVPQITVLLVADTPYSGTKLNATVTAGGYEGSSTQGNGCCENPATPPTLSVELSQPESTASGNALPYTTYALSFLKGQNSNGLFTGKKAPISTIGDVFASEFVAPAFNTSSVEYSIGEIIEAPFADQTTCRANGRFKSCYTTTITLPDVKYDEPASAADVCKPTTDSTAYTGSLLTEVLRIDSSLIKGNPTPDLTLINVKYYIDPLELTQFKVLETCSATSGFPCICSRYQYIKNVPGGLLPFSNDTKGDIEIVVKNWRNGMLAFD